MLMYFANENVARELCPENSLTSTRNEIYFILFYIYPTYFNGCS